MGVGIKVTSRGLKLFACCRVGSGSLRLWAFGPSRNSAPSSITGSPRVATLCSAYHHRVMKRACVSFTNDSGRGQWAVGSKTQHRHPSVIEPLQSCALAEEL